MRSIWWMPTSALDLSYQLRVMECVRQMVGQHQLIAVIVLHDISLAAQVFPDLRLRLRRNIRGGRSRFSGFL